MEPEPERADGDGDRDRVLTVSGSGDVLEVRAPGKLTNTGAVAAFFEELEELIEEYSLRSSEGASAACRIGTLDLSRNHLTARNFESLFVTLVGVCVKRFRFCRISTLDDEAVKVVAKFLQDAPTTSLPVELHMNDCSITSEGFIMLMEAIEGNDSFPVTSEAPDRFWPLMLHLDGNFIDEALIVEKVTAGTIRPCPMSMKRKETDKSTVKVDFALPSRRGTGYYQRTSSGGSKRQGNPSHFLPPIPPQPPQMLMPFPGGWRIPMPNPVSAAGTYMEPAHLLPGHSSERMCVWGNGWSDPSLQTPYARTQSRRRSRTPPIHRPSNRHIPQSASMSNSDRTSGEVRRPRPSTARGRSRVVPEQGSVRRVSSFANNAEKADGRTRSPAQGSYPLRLPSGRPVFDPLSRLGSQA